MKRRRPQKAPKKSSSQKYKRRRRRELGKRAIKDQHRIMREFEFAQRLPDIHVPEVKNEKDCRSTSNNMYGLLCEAGRGRK